MNAVDPGKLWKVLVFTIRWIQFLALLQAITLIVLVVK